MKLNKQDVVKALKTISVPGEGGNLIDSKAVNNIMVFGDEIDLDVRLSNPSLQARKKLEVTILEVIYKTTIGFFFDILSRFTKSKAWLERLDL